MTAFHKYPGAFDEVVDSPPTEQQVLGRYERFGTTFADHPARNGSEQAPNPLALLPFLNASSWQDNPIPSRRWLVRHRIPMSNVTLLQGDGAAGKTTIALQLCVAVACGLDWLGALIDEPGASCSFRAKKMRMSCIVELQTSSNIGISHSGSLGAYIYSVRHVMMSPSPV